ncbi:hypothetical protein QVD99_006242 [Batrachochytrium dendrobatidis]|nr:hypothetical protein O5D80_003414 [Batrachochytrium dendrobatidis]KAK5667026.1 hypothetical protein QVD99_006242 [Batrachochytrium dendrobatidis]
MIYSTLPPRLDARNHAPKVHHSITRPPHISTPYNTIASSPQTSADIIASFTAVESLFERQQLLSSIVGACTAREIRFIQSCIRQRTATKPLTPSPTPPSLISLDAFEEVADEIIVHILSFIHAPAELSQCAQVSRRFYRIMADNALWRVICVQKKFEPLYPSADTHPTQRDDFKWRSIAPQNVYIPLGSSPQSENDRFSIGWPIHRGQSIESSGSVEHKKSGCKTQLMLSPWKQVYMENYLTWMNWLNGRYQLVPVQRKPTQSGLCVSFDDRFAVSVKLGDPGQLFDIQTGRCYMLFAGHTGMISAVKFNQKLLVSAGSDATLRIWEISSGRCERVIEGHLGEITCLQLDDDIVISGSEDHTAKIWQISTGTCLKTFQGHTGAICCLQNTSTTLVTGSTDTTIRVWDIQTASCKRQLTGHTGHVFCIQFDLEYICSGSNDTCIKIWSAKSGKLIRTLTGHHLGVVCLQFDHTKIVSGSADKTIKVWSIKTGHNLYTLNHHTGSLWALHFTTNKMVSSSIDGSLLIWDFAFQKSKSRVCGRRHNSSSDRPTKDVDRLEDSEHEGAFNLLDNGN